MLIPLIILAVLSVVGGWVGVPAALGGSNHFEKFLAPVFQASSHEASTSRVVTGEVAAAQKQTEAPEPTEASRGMELMFTGISVTGSALGFLLAWWLYLRNPELPEKIAKSLGGVYEAVVHKYYVDEFYAALLVKPLVNGSTNILWHGVDQNVIDAAVNEGADGARHVSDNVRQMQSGNLRSYAGWVAAGAALVIAYMVWMGAR